MKRKYGIINRDISNFDKFGFKMGVISIDAVVTDSEI